MSVLFQPFSLRDLTLENRTVISSMCQYSADNGQATVWHHTHLGSLSLSGAELLMIEATVVPSEGRITNSCLGLRDDAVEVALECTLVTICQNVLMPIGMQIVHVGRKVSSARPWEGGVLLALDAGGWEAMGLSSLSQHPEERPPCEVADVDLARVRDQSADTARQAVRSGLSAAGLHVAHGYLLYEFLSPTANQRADAFGGSCEDRMRYPLEIFDAVRAVVPDNVPVGVCVSATDWVEGGQTPEDSVASAQVLRARGCDWIDVPSGGASPLQQIPLSTGYQVPFTGKIRNEADTPTIVVGLINEAHEAEAIVAQGCVDLVAVGRASLYNPYWAWAAVAELGVTVKAPLQYWRVFLRHTKNPLGDMHFGACRLVRACADVASRAYGRSRPTCRVRGVGRVSRTW